MGTYPPALTIAAGHRVRTSTPDAHGHGADDRPLTGLVNPQVGPIAVAGAAPGDVLAVRLERVWPNRRRGYGEYHYWPLKGNRGNWYEPTTIGGWPLPRWLVLESDGRHLMT